jgi:cobalamin biosynthesis protein CobT
MAEIFIENIIASATISQSLDLEQLLKALPNCEYNPNQFSGVVFRPDDPKVVILLFDDGRVMVTAARNMEDVETSINLVEKRLKDAKMIIPVDKKKKEEAKKEDAKDKKKDEKAEEEVEEKPAEEVTEEGEGKEEKEGEEKPQEPPDEEKKEGEEKEKDEDKAEAKEEKKDEAKKDKGAKGKKK